MLNLLSWSPVATPPAYGRIVKEGCVPTLKDDPKWVRGELEVFFANFPDAVDVLWESVLTLWRLKMAGSKDLKVLAWEEMVSAWMVSAS